MKVLTAARMREVDRLMIESGIPGIVLMENAACRVVEYMAGRWAPLREQRILVLCGKGNNGGDGLAIARQLFTRFRPAALHAVLLAAPEELKGDAAANLAMLRACGCPVLTEVPAEASRATLVVDALLGAGLNGPATGRMLEAIRLINTAFPGAAVMAVDIPSGLPSDFAHPVGEHARADATVTFTALKPAHVLPPNCDSMGEVRVGAIGSPASLYEDVALELVEPAMLRPLFAPRARASHKGDYGHVLVVAGSPGKTGAAAMTGLAALRGGAGLVTVASDIDALPSIAAHCAEVMTAAFDASWTQLLELARDKDLLAIGPGLGTGAPAVSLVRRAYAELPLPMVLDADALNALAAQPLPPPPAPRVLTPHPGEMSRLTGKPTREIQADRVGAAREFATAHGVCLVLKGQRSAIAFPDGRVWINPTGSPAMAKGGSGDILTGLIAALLAQFPESLDRAVAAAVYLHGLCGEYGAAVRGEKSLLATELLDHLASACDSIGLDSM